jgi:hypothetical protein
MHSASLDCLWSKTKEVATIGQALNYVALPLAVVQRIEAYWQAQVR